MIKAKRASITIKDRTALEALADGFYGVPEQEYRRVVGGSESRHEAAPRVVAA